MLLFGIIQSRSSHFLFTALDFRFAKTGRFFRYKNISSSSGVIVQDYELCIELSLSKKRKRTISQSEMVTIPRVRSGRANTFHSQLEYLKFQVFILLGISMRLKEDLRLPTNYYLG